MKSRSRFIGILLLAGALFSLLPRFALPASGLLEKLQPIEDKVSKVRSLSFQKPIDAKSASKADIIVRIIQELQLQFTPDEMKDYETSLAKLGAIPPGTDLMGIIVELYGEEVAGMYDPRSKLLLLNEEYAGPYSDLVIAHELTHALQDQHFDLMSFPLDLKHEDDLVLATHSVLEGDATILMAEYFLSGTGATTEMLGEGFANMVKAMLPAYGGALGNAPPFIAAVLLFPYSYGTEFVHFIRAPHGWDGVNALYRIRPLSTEQVLHPLEKFIHNDPPTHVDIPSLAPILGQGWRALADNVVGEFQMRLLLENLLADPARAAAAAAGWDGDRYRCYQSSDAVILSWMTVWDSPADAEEFFQAYKEVLDKKYPDAKPSSPPDGHAYARSVSGQVSYVAIRENQVIVLEGLPSELLPQAEDLLWDAGLTQLPAADTSLFGAPPASPGPSPAPAFFRPKGEVKGNLFVSKDLGFEIPLPGPDWFFFDELPIPMMAVSIVHNTRIASVNVIVQPFPPVLTLQQLAEMIKAGMRAQAGGFEVIDEGEVQLSGEKGYQFTAILNMGTLQKVRQLLVQHGGKIFIITSSGEAGDFDALRDEILNMETKIALHPEQPPAQEAPK